LHRGTYHSVLPCASSLTRRAGAATQRAPERSNWAMGGQLSAISFQPFGHWRSRSMRFRQARSTREASRRAALRAREALSAGQGGRGGRYD
jgi:hypothetical protein